jgi:hypothetical protein
MSMNAALNAIVALIEGNTTIAKEIIRTPGSDVNNVPAIIARLDRAINKTGAVAIRNALVKTLEVRLDEKTLKSIKVINAPPEEIFFMGVTAVETILSDIAYNLENGA